MIDWITEDGAWNVHAAPSRSAMPQGPRCRMELAGSDGPLYTSEEAFIDRRGRRDSGFFLDSTARSAFDPRGGSRLAAMCAKLREMGIRLVTIVDPGVKRDACYPLYVEGCRTGHFCGKRRGNKAVSRRRGEEPQARIV